LERRRNHWKVFCWFTEARSKKKINVKMPSQVSAKIINASNFKHKLCQCEKIKNQKKKKINGGCEMGKWSRSGINQKGSRALAEVAGDSRGHDGMRPSGEGSNPI
jgi:hypothetical protein